MGLFKERVVKTRAGYSPKAVVEGYRTLLIKGVQLDDVSPYLNTIQYKYAWLSVREKAAVLYAFAHLYVKYAEGDIVWDVLTTSENLTLKLFNEVHSVEGTKYSET